MLRLIDNRPRITATTLYEFLLKDTLEPYFLQRTVVEGDLDLHFTHITRCIEIRDAEFTGKIDIRNAIFEGTVLFRNSIFRNDLIAGDEKLTNTLFKSDVCFDESVFFGFVLFCGFHCNGSASFDNCSFMSTDIRYSTILKYQPPVEFTGGSVGKEFSINKSIFKGWVSFNSLHCDYGGFFHCVRFENTSEFPIDFIASSYGITLELIESEFECSADLSGISCGLSFNADLVRFNHENNSANFSNLKTDYFSARGASFAGPVNFGGLHCGKSVNLEPFQIGFKYLTTEPWEDGEIPHTLKSLIVKQIITFPPIATITQHNGVWFLKIPGTSVQWWVFRNDVQVTVIKQTAFLSSFDFSYADIGLNLNLNFSILEKFVDFNNMSCNGDAYLEGAIFQGEIHFEQCRFRSLYLRGASFLNNVFFTSLSCYQASFDSYDILVENLIPNKFVNGKLSSSFKNLLVQKGFNFGRNNRIRYWNGKWLIFDENKVLCAFITHSDSQMLLSVVTRFLGDEISFNLGQFSYLMMDNAYVKSKATFNALHCTAGAFFRHTLFKSIVDFRYGEYSINIQMEYMQTKSDVSFESISIHNDLIIKNAVFHNGADFTGARIKRLITIFNIHRKKKLSSNPFRRKKSNFSDCTLNSFIGNWLEIVDQQNPEIFSLDPFLMLERCNRITGKNKEADEIYIEGRRREMWHTFKHKNWSYFVRSLFWNVFAGYGVRRFRAFFLGFIVIVLGIFVFWSDESLLPNLKSEESKSNSNSVNKFAKIFAEWSFSDSSMSQMEKPKKWFKEFVITLNKPTLERFISRLAFSIDAFVPVDLEISKLYRPAPGWRQLYYAAHILSGWILIPLLIAALTGYLEKR